MTGDGVREWSAVALAIGLIRPPGSIASPMLIGVSAPVRARNEV